MPRVVFINHLMMLSLREDDLTVSSRVADRGKGKRVSYPSPRETRSPELCLNYIEKGGFSDDFDPGQAKADIHPG